MTIKIHFFASLREALGVATLEMRLPDEINTLGMLRNHLAARGEPWAVLTRAKNLRAALNQQLVDFDEPVKAGDEVAFFPPVTGG